MRNIITDGHLHISTPVAKANVNVVKNAEVGIYTKVYDTLPIYTGTTTVTPSEEAQTLKTERKSLMSDIVINPIPSNYGRIEWDGATLKVF